MKKPESFFNFSPFTFAILALSLLCFSSGSAFSQTEPIKILFIGPITGGSSPLGLSMRDGAKMAVSEINKSGGVLGRQIDLLERDDRAKADVGLKISQDSAAEKVVAVVGFANSGVASASAQVFQQSKIPVIVSVATATVITRAFENQSENYIFRMAAHDSLQAPLIVEEAIVKRGFKKPAILSDSTGYGQGGRVDLEQSLSFKRLMAVSVGTFKVGDTDMTEQLKKAKDAGADVIFGYSQGPELAAIANSAAKMGWKVPLYAAWTMSTSSFIEAALANGDGNKMPQTFIQNPNSPKRKAFIESYIATYKPANGVIQSPVSAAQSYDAVYVMAAAIKQAGSTDGLKIQQALENLAVSVDGVVTKYSRPFSKTDHEAITSNMVVFGEIKNGRVVFANPSDAETINRLKISNDKFDLYKR